MTSDPALNAYLHARWVLFLYAFPVVIAFLVVTGLILWIYGRYYDN